MDRYVPPISFGVALAVIGGLAAGAFDFSSQVLVVLTMASGLAMAFLLVRAAPAGPLFESRRATSLGASSAQRAEVEKRAALVLIGHVDAGKTELSRALRNELLKNWQRVSFGEYVRHVATKETGNPDDRMALLDLGQHLIESLGAPAFTAEVLKYFDVDPDRGPVLIDDVYHAEVLSHLQESIGAALVVNVTTTMWRRHLKTLVRSGRRWLRAGSLHPVMYDYPELARRAEATVSGHNVRKLLEQMQAVLDERHDQFALKTA